MKWKRKKSKTVTVTTEEVETLERKRTVDNTDFSTGSANRVGLEVGVGDDLRI